MNLSSSLNLPGKFEIDPFPASPRICCSTQFSILCKAVYQCQIMYVLKSILIYSVPKVSEADQTNNIGISLP